MRPPASFSMAPACPVLLDRVDQFDDNGFPICLFLPSGCDAESEHLYRPGGLPPVDIGDKFDDGRFTVVYKLGYGWSSTVWLAHDEETEQYVALKMMSAGHAEFAMQLKVQELLFQDTKSPHHPQILTILDSFDFASPNGQHTCFVFEWTGPSLNDTLGRHKIRPDCARKLSKDIASAIQHLHANEVAFGDLSTDNILLRLKISRADAAAFVQRLSDKVYACELEVFETREAWQHHGPNSQYGTISYRDFEPRMLIPEVSLTDLNEAVMLDSRHGDESKKDDSATRLTIAAPEHIFGHNRRHSKASDIWSLACCFFHIRTCKPLIRSGISSSEYTSVGCEIARLLGPPPQSMRDAIESFPEHVGNDILSEIDNGQEKDYKTLEERIRAVGSWHPWVTMTWEQRRQYYIEFIGKDFANDPEHHHSLEDRPPPPAKLSNEETRDFYDLLSKMMRYSPSERMTIEEVMVHPWLNTTYNDLDEPAEWISYYNGFEYMDLNLSNKFSRETKSEVEGQGEMPSAAKVRENTAEYYSDKNIDTESASEETTQPAEADDFMVCEAKQGPALIAPRSLGKDRNVAKERLHLSALPKNSHPIECSRPEPEFDVMSSSSDEDSSTSDDVFSLDDNKLSCSGILDMELDKPEPISNQKSIDSSMAGGEVGAPSTKQEAHAQVV